jgi:8-hydroxy-5-deazaflavin:NADPH oxidoreductase
MKLGIIGAGSLGTALGARLQRAGHAIMFGGGTPARDAGAHVGSNSQAARFGDVVILAVPFAAINAALADAGPLRSRVLWSCVNAPEPDLTGLAVGFDDSAAEQVARLAPGARVVAAIPPSRARLRLRRSPTTPISRRRCSCVRTTRRRRRRWRDSCETWAGTPSTPVR